MSKINKRENQTSPIELVIHIIGSKWTIAIVRDLATGPKRPSELSKSISGINAKTLTQRLRELEKWGLVERKAFNEIPPRVNYMLSEQGRQLLFILEAIRDLGQSWQQSINIDVPPDFKEQCNHCFDYLKDSAMGSEVEQPTDD